MNFILLVENYFFNIFVVCTVMEHIVHSHLMKFLENNKIISVFEHGFRKRKSCEIQLITIIHGIATGLDRWQKVGAILLDFSKAFDKAPHHRLAVRFLHYGIRARTILDPKFPGR